MFRQAALKAQNKRLYGEISLAQPISLYLIVFLLLVTIAAFLLFLSQSSYSRKETVRGYLLPDAGVIKVYPNRNGHLDKLFVNPGDRVKKGDVVARIVVSSPQTDGVELSESLLKNLTDQYDLLVANEEFSNQMAILKLTRLQQKASDLTASSDVIRTQIGLLKQKQAIQLNEQRRFVKLYQNGYVSDVETQKQRNQLLDVQQQLETLKAQQLSVRSQLNEVNADIHSHPIQTEIAFADIGRQKAVIQRQIDETQNGYEFTVVAKESGLISAIAANEGEFLLNNRPIMSILPEGSELIAELLLPTRSAGFVRHNTETRLRFDAFPYQRFGFVHAFVSHIDRSLLLQGEADIPIELNEPVYRVQTKLSTQTISAYGEEFSLKPGMMLEADIILDKRTLLDWILDPIYSLRGRIG